jgi:dTDP-4-dehydrorhamnose reductase
MSRPLVLVTGANGQLGQSVRSLADSFPELEFAFLSREDLPIEDAEKVNYYFEKARPSWCINTAAYTAVDKAESDRERAFAVNRDATGILAATSDLFGTRFIHVSTDYVFDGQSAVPYKEHDKLSPVNAYGASKLEGEQLCMEKNPASMIIRTAWVYSEFGNNFVKTMLRLMSSRPEINVVDDQVGAPTYAVDLANAILTIIGNTEKKQTGWSPGIYHYSNKGRISWYDFAVAIKELAGLQCKINPIPSSQYPTPAKRPSFSLLDTQKIREVYNIHIPDWRESLSTCMARLAAAEQARG